MRIIHEYWLGIRSANKRVQPKKSLVWLLASILALLLVAFFSAAYVLMAWRNYIQFATGIDLAGYGQALYHLSNGRLPFSSFKNAVLWGDHAHFILAFIAPLYRLIPDPRVLLVVQAVVATTSGWAIFAVAKKLTNSVVLALTILYSYLSFIGLQYALDFDFHPSVLTGALLAWFIYAWYFKKWWLLWLSLGLGLITREDAPTIFFTLAFYFFLHDFIASYISKRRRKKLNRHWKFGLIAAVIAMIYFLIVAYWIMPLWTRGGTVLAYLDIPDRDPYNIIRGFFVYPDAILQNIFDTETKRATMHTLFQAFAYLPFLAPFTLFGIAPIFYARFNSPNDYRWIIENHSNANVWPIMAFGALFGISIILWLVGQARLKWLNRLTAIILSLVLVGAVHQTAWQDVKVPLRVLWRELRGEARPEIANRRHVFSKIEELIPKNDNVVASAGFTAALSNRDGIKNYPELDENTQWIVVTSDRHVDTWPLTEGPMKNEIKLLQDNSTYQLEYSAENIWLFKVINPRKYE